ncbi:MAG: hypothetical protein QOE70_3734 [Chthoniobacter sp.]|jgi:thioester reductase-like protein|nr:hypothetical protein [Chthoniobacter sp.]
MVRGVKTARSTLQEPIAIIGIGCRFPGGANGPDAFWELLAGGFDAISEVPPERWNLRTYFDAEAGKPGKTYSKWAGLIEGIDQFDPQFFGISPREAAFIDPQQRLLLEATWEAFEDAGQPLDLEHGSNTGVFVGISTNDYALMQSSAEVAQIDAYSATGSTMSIAANRISYCLNLRGPSLPVDTACSSSLVAVHLACQALREGECGMAIAAGVNVIASPCPFIAFSSMGMLSPDGRCKAFDAGANGFVRGEGVGAILLKPLAAALAAGDPIHAVIRGTGVNQDGRTPGMTVPSQEAQEKLVLETCAAAGLDPALVQYVEAHGTGTAVGDPIEANALGAALNRGRARNDVCAIGSVKTNIGHLEAAAGVAGIIKAALALEHGLIPPSLHFQQANPQIDFERLKLRVPLATTRFRNGADRAIAGVNSFGWGGTNAHALLEAPPARRPAGGREGRRAWLIPISARSPEALTALAHNYAGFLRAPGAPPLRDISYSALLRRTHFEYRIAFSGRTKRELASQCEEFARGESRSSAAQPTAERKIAFVFSGQGPQWWRMGRDLLEREPVFRAKIEECDALLREFAGWSLIAELTADEDASRLDHTGIAQPAIFALQVALAALWRSWGVEPDAVIGHSVGEVGAAHLAGVFDLREALRVIFHRGDSMEQITAPGRMLAVGLAADEAESFVAAHRGRVSLAAVNSPSSVTLSGDPERLEAIAAGLEPRQIFARFVPVQYAFHSAQMDPVQPALRAALNGLAPGRAQIAIASTVTGRLAAGPEFDTAYWWRNVRETVQFRAGIDSLIDGGCRVFVELSPHPVLGPAIRECLAHRGVPGAVIASLQRQTDDQSAMLSALGALHALGHPVKWDALFPRGGHCVRLPAHPMQRDRFWNEPELFRQFRLGAAPHPFLAQRVPSAEACWQVKLDRRVFPWLNDHRVQGRAVFPATGFLEMALAAARELFGAGSSVIEDVDLLTALFLPETDEAPTLELIFHAEDSSFTINSRTSAAAQTWTTHVTGKMGVQPGAVPARSLDLEAVRARCPTEGSPAALYAELADGGLQYGPCFQGLEKFWRRDRESVAQVRLPARVAGEAGNFIVHPAYLDACFHPSFAALPVSGFDRESGVYLPIHVDRLQVFAPPPPVSWVCAELLNVTRRSFTGDMRLLDPQGKVCVEMTGARLRFLEGGNRELRDLLYELQWQLKPLPGMAPTRAADFIPDVAALGRRLQIEADRLKDELGLAARWRELEPDVDALCDAYVWRAFAELGWKPRRGERVSTAALLQRLSVAPKYQRLLNRYLDRLESGGFLRRAAGSEGWVVRRTARALDLPKAWRALLARLPSGAPELTLIESCGRRLAEVLRGAVDPLQLMFPGGSTTTLERFYADSLLCRVPYTIALEAVSAALARLPEGRKLRIIELGAGTGGTTARLLPQLPPDRVEYLFTDISNFFFAKAEQKFQDFPFLRCELLDIEKSPAEQGFEPHRAEIIIVAAVLHATADLRTVLANIRQLLAPDGLLIFGELEQAPGWFDLVFGLTDGWWRYQDFDLRPDGPLLPQREWKSLLAQSGFRSVSAVTCDRQMVFLARGPRAEIPTGPSLPDAAGRWLLFADQTGMADELAALLQARGATCISVPFGETGGMQRVTAELAAEPGLRGIVHLWSLDVPADDGLTADAIDEAQTRGSLSVLQLVQSLAALEDREPPPLWLVTRGAQPAGDHAHRLAMAQTPLVGLSRVIRNEHSNLRCRLIDLSPAHPLEESSALLAELLTPDDEDEIAWRGEARYVERVARGTTQAGTRGPTQFVPIRQRPCRLEAANPGLLERLALQPISRRKPKAGEIEIEVAAAGLNFRDVMKALDILPSDGEEAALLGDECAGRVVAVGPGVRGVRVSDEVMAIGAGCLASHVTTHFALAFPKPPQASFEEAATLPIAYLTASYALFHLGRMRRGERVLIHAAAGGVGFAAVQLAQHVGAQVFATAGSEEKRDFLRACGVEHVFDSRTLAFAEEIMERTGGRGVDLVLNSLAGEAIPKSLSVLGPHGRFLEIGKRDIYQNAKLGLRPFRNNLSFFAVDLSRMLNPERIRELAGTLPRQLARGLLPPLPYRTFPIGDAVSAFRYMAQAKQIGKVVITMQSEKVAGELRPAKGRAEFRTHGTYLITGGLGGFGLVVAQWMAANGARNLVLMGRTGVSTDEARAAVQAMEKAGARVVIARGDVSREQDVRKVLEQISRTLPPLRGVMHAAMVLDDAILLQLDAARFYKVTAPKIRGAWHLHQLTLGRPLDFFVLFSSIASVFGNPGQANYIAANAFLTALAHHRHALGLPALAINWGLLTDAGYVARTPRVQEYLASIGLVGLDSRRAVQVLARLLPNPRPQVIVSGVDWPSVPPRLASAPRFSQIIREMELGPQGKDDAPRIRESVLSAAPAEARRIIVAWLSDQIGKVLRLPAARLEANKPLTELGLDSLMAVELMYRVESQLGASIPTGKLMGGPTIARLADLLLEALTGTAPESAAAPAVERVDFAAETMLDPEIRFDARPVRPRQFSQPSALFLTGTGGLLNAFLLCELLRRTGADLYCLMTAGSVDEARLQLAGQLKELGLDADLARIVPVLGRLAEPLFGLSETQFASLGKKIGAIFHNGAEVNQVAPYRQLKPANVSSVETVLRLATHARLKPVHYVSAVAVLSAASDPAAGSVLESDALARPEALLGGYAQSRWIAEKLLAAARAQGLPVNIYRPGLPIGNASSGPGSADDLVWRVLKACLELGSGPTLEIDTFITPVDYISQAIVHLSRQRELAGQTFHLVHPQRHTVSDLLRSARSFGYPVELVANDEWEAQLTARDASRKDSPLLPYVLLLPGQVQQALRGYGSFPAIDGQNAQNGLAGSGIHCPPLDDAQLHPCFEFFVRAGAFPPPPRAGEGTRRKRKI